MSNDLKKIGQCFAESVIYMLAAALAVGVLMIDIILLGNDVGEASLVEYTQEFLLLVTVFLYYQLAWRHKVMRNAHILVGGFILCMFIREFDSVFDEIVHGFWFYPAITVALVSLALTFGLKPKVTLHQLAEFTRPRQYAYLIIGLVTVLVFSRLFGMKIIWETLLKDGYARVVKNAAEESLELFGYVLCFTSALLHNLTMKKKLVSTEKLTAKA